MNEHQKMLSQRLIEKNARSVFQAIKADADQAGGTGSYAPGMGILREAMAQIFRETMDANEVLTTELQSRVIDGGDIAKEKGLICREYFFKPDQPLVYGSQQQGEPESDGMRNAYMIVMDKALKNGGPDQ